MSPEYDGPFLELAHDPLTYERIHKDVYASNFEPSQIFKDGGPSFISTDIFSALPKHIEQEETAKVKLTEEDIQFLKGTYDSAVLYADMWLDIFFRELEDRGRWQNTIIAVLSDHGEDLLDHGIFNHRAGLWDSTTHVPMIVWGPGIEPGVIDEVVSTMDLGATILGAAGIHNGNFPGHDWINQRPVNRPPVISEGIGLKSVVR